MNIKSFALLASASLAFTLVACAPTSGTVKDKSYSPAFTSWTAAYWSGGTCSSRSKNGSCLSYSPRMYHPSRPVYHHASFNLQISDGRDEGWREVSSPTFENCSIGQHFENESCVLR